MTKLPLSEPHSIYLPMPAALGAGWDCDYETSGATVKLDAEQLPYASRHYITAQRFIRIADDSHELTVACPDAPLWQIGGYTFGRFGEPDGRVDRQSPTLVAWLTNNYWSTNFQADQGGQMKFRFWVLPSVKRSLGASAQAALALAQPLAAHVYAERGPLRQEKASLLRTELGGLLLTRLEAEGKGVALSLLNPGNEPVEARIGAGLFRPTQATRTSLSGTPGEAIPCSDGEVRITVAPRAWTRVALT